MQFEQAINYGINKHELLLIWVMLRNVQMWTCPTQNEYFFNACLAIRHSYHLCTPPFTRDVGLAAPRSSIVLPRNQLQIPIAKLKMCMRFIKHPVSIYISKSLSCVKCRGGLKIVRFIKNPVDRGSIYRGVLVHGCTNNHNQTLTSRHSGTYLLCGSASSSSLAQPYCGGLDQRGQQPWCSHGLGLSKVHRPAQRTHVGRWIRGMLGWNRE